MWQCFPGQKAPLNGNLNPRSHTQSNQYHTDAEPRMTEPLSPPWIQVQKPAAAKISSPHRALAELPVPGHELTSMSHIICIVDARIGKRAVGYNELWSQPDKKCLMVFIYSQGTSTRKKLSYGEVLSAPNGVNALKKYFSEVQREPEGQESNWPGWLLTTFEVASTISKTFVSQIGSRLKLRQAPQSMPKLGEPQSTPEPGEPQSTPELGEPYIDIVKAETKYGISFLQRYRGIFYNNGQPDLLYSTYYQTNKEGIISCPVHIDASQLTSDQRGRLRFLLNIARNMIPEHDLNILCAHYNITKDDVLVVYSEDPDYF
ncbi:hypothetical protein BDW59DRAFT_155359 [Aspergillus cavernicola]|uniref:Uncharacterized protein n=1 Tax=Aspergillus cavernicola TaxID=176166 RepID=A0ABR4H9Q6_9EURO